MPQAPTFDERFIEVFENIAGMRSDIRHTDADVSTLRTDMSEIRADISEIKADISKIKADVSELKTDVSEIRTDVAGLRDDMTGMEGRLHSNVNRQVWTAMSVMATIMVASVGLTGYFIKILA